MKTYQIVDIVYVNRSAQKNKRISIHSTALMLENGFVLHTPASPNSTVIKFSKRLRYLHYSLYTYLSTLYIDKLSE